MKKPKTVQRLCPFCKKHGEHKITLAKRRTPGSTHPMSAGSKKRMKKRGVGVGIGNMGKLSRGAIASFKMTGKKLTKKADFRYECKACGKTHGSKKGIRAKKVEFEQ